MVQLLETREGVVVQGPPGTGKTHTIANIICHWLASGRRVLVTSMQEPALAVLREQLPEEIRPLAIALLASEHEGMQQFEESIQRIATGVQSIDPAVTGARDRAAPGDHRRAARSHRAHRHRAQPLGAPESAGDRSGRRAGGSARGRPAGARPTRTRSSGCRTGSGPARSMRRASPTRTSCAWSRRGAPSARISPTRAASLPAPVQVSGSVGAGANAPGSDALGTDERTSCATPRHRRGWKRCRRQCARSRVGRADRASACVAQRNGGDGQALAAARARAPARATRPHTSSAFWKRSARELEQAAQDQASLSGSAGRGCPPQRN